MADVTTTATLLCLTVIVGLNLPLVRQRFSRLPLTFLGFAVAGLQLTLYFSGVRLYLPISPGLVRALEPIVCLAMIAVALSSSFARDAEPQPEAKEA